MLNEGMFTSVSSEWKTPRDFFTKVLDPEFHFTTDVGATKENALVPDYLGLDNGRDALTTPWGLRNYSNPPYGDILNPWVKKAYIETFHGKLSVLLLPGRTDTAWWHDYVIKYVHPEDIRFIRGRLKFDIGPHNHKRPPIVGCTKLHSAPFPSVVVIFRPIDNYWTRCPCAGENPY